MMLGICQELQLNVKREKSNNNNKVGGARFDADDDQVSQRHARTDTHTKSD
jgi:hypothetical protein